MSHDTIINPVYLTLKSNESTYALNDKKSHLEFELYRPIKVNSNIDIYLSVESFKFTNSIYNVNQYHNIFYFSLSPLFVPNSVTIAKGNYSITSLVNLLNASLVSFGFSFTFDSTVSKLKITNATAFQIYNNDKNINKIIGFDNAIINGSAGVPLIAPNMVNLIGTQMLYVAFPNISLTSYSVKSSSSHSVVASIPIVSIQGDTQVYSGNFRHKVSDAVITKIEILINDEDGNEVSFNNIDWFITLNFVFVYKKDYREPTLLADIQDTSQTTEDVGVSN